MVAYVDGTQDPYWTRHYAASGKVSRIGRVLPCLSRVALSSGPGVPLLVETLAGTAKLKSILPAMLKRLDDELGTGEVGRLTIVDAEMGSAGSLYALEQSGRCFVTVIKGTVLKGAKQSGHGSWQAYRKGDELRELALELNGTGAPAKGILLRGVEMRRSGSRHPVPTLFATNTPPEMLSTIEVVDAYLSRWPYQEQFFRNSRNGGGLNRSHGYGGELVAHVALETKLEKSERRVVRARRSRNLAETRVADLAIASMETKEHPTALEREAKKLAEKEQDRTEGERQQALMEHQKLTTTPRHIYLRDTGRDNIMTCLKLTLLLLVEYVLKEYFGGLRMELRTFIEELNLLPVTVRTSKRQVLYQIHSNPRNPGMMKSLEHACEQINQRRLCHDKRTLRFEVLITADRGS